MKKILLINDCKFESIIMRDILSALNYEVQITNEYEATYYVKLFKPEAVIANLIMKETTGDKLIARIKKISPSTICILSSCGTISHQQFKDCGLEGIMRTPINKGELEVLLNQLVKEKVQPIIAFCPYCGENLKDLNKNLAFCPYCGEKLSN